MRLVNKDQISAELHHREGRNRPRMLSKKSTPTAGKANDPGSQEEKACVMYRNGPGGPGKEEEIGWSQIHSAAGNEIRIWMISQAWIAIRNNRTLLCGAFICPRTEGG